ncbi:2-oxoglutarate dehydrogenase, mitochondrial-like [Senna tora]|uniref:2-oxoglutarate dehydrogenase, mitochondrial n=1 Tax=Senna tora TaxID=362788 RepID=A0A834TGN9_9FABA|nr:2-oxoglutarate dehydrogenase, mitochondrial-like [Senna tora]
MAWFRAGSGIVKHAIRRTLSQGGSSYYATRTRVLPSQSRYFHSTVFKSKAQTAPVPRPVPLSRLTDSFLDGTSSVYLEELQRAWEADPNSVDESWDNFFRNFVGQATTSPGISGQTIQESMRLLLLVRAYQVNGHMKAKLDPLGLEQRATPEELDPALYGFSEADLDREFFLGVWRMSGFLSENRPVQTLRSILTRLEQAYCGSIGYEYMHIADREKCNWLRDKIETPTPTQLNRERREVILDRLAWSTLFENFLATKWTSAKRFGTEGGETIIPGMKEMIDRAADLGVESIVIGMAHRARLNVLGNVVRKPLRQIFSEFSGGQPEDEVGLYTGTGDVKYHLGTSYDRPTRGAKRIHLSLVANPSHLEAVDPVVVGKTRAKQYFSNDVDRTKHMAILIHGDGSFAGQGVVYETLHLSALPNYTTGGTIHLVFNNQVAFTTDPSAGRSSQYCTDVAKALDAPIFHVNGDDVEAVVHAFELAAEWRQTFHSDVVVDLVCYRRFGHNEIDEPSFTQPKMYKVIRSHPSTLEIYEKKLLELGEVTQEDVDKIHKKITSILNEEFLASKEYVPKRRDWLSAYWSGFKSPEQLSRIRNTGVKPEILKNVGKAITVLPENFTPHRAVRKIYEQRAQMVETGEGIDWGFAEALAFATLLVEGNHVRLSGQDVERGTFSHRHSVVHDQETGEIYCPLDHVIMNQNEEMFTVSNRIALLSFPQSSCFVISLSEFGVLGFELGYSMENPNSLVIWEAQFGDFANGAQVIFDNFISSGEAKWLRQTGLVVLLPHGYDGQGPEHSSGRVERYLQMADDNPYIIPEMDPTLRKQIQECNWQIVNVTTPANFFHVLRRQIHREFRKPLIVMSPKNLLRHKDCKSNLSEFDDVQGHPGFDKQGTRFKRLIKDQNDHSDLEEGIRRLVLCSGKVYYELDDERRKADAKDVAICRVEQLCPFPYDLVQRELKRYPNAEIVWCQEEPMNMGGYTYILPRLISAMKALGRGGYEDVKYIGRAPSAATATGFYKVHLKEQAEIVQKAIQPEPITFPY